ncbi:MAG: AsmA family protein [Bacteroidales bacterium]|jgi:hypothetical protein|nr:AsmA family protein [Bacteroidales bacterium]
MKKFLKIFFIVIAVLFLVLLITPFLFKGKLIEIAKKELNNMLTVKVDFSDLKLSFIRNFPNAYVALSDLQVVGTGEFEADTLASLKRFSVTVDIMSVIKMDNIEIKAVLLDQAKVYAHVLENGKVNWDVMKPSDEPEEKTEDESSDTDIQISLKKFEIRNAQIVYRDDSSKMAAAVKNLDFLLKGDMSMENTTLSMQLDIKTLDFWMNNIRMVRDARINFVSDIAADLKNMAFTFNHNQFKLNDIILKFDGTVKMPGDDIITDITFATERTDFKSLLSLIPAVYMKDFESIQTKGNLTLEGYAKGTYNDKQMPNVGLTLNVDDAMFKYPDLPQSVEKINIALKLFYDGVKFDNTTLDVNKFHFEMAKNPFDLELHVKTPESDLQVAGEFKGIIDFNSISSIIPLDDMKLNGILECDLILAGRMSTLEKQQYEDFDAKGMLKLTGFSFTSPDFPQGVKISSTHLDFTPKVVHLVNLDAVVGRTDVSLKGSLENFIPYVFKGSTIRGNLSLSSNVIDLNEFMSGEETETTTETDTVPLSIIEVPKNIDFTINAKINHIYFDKLDISSTVGNLFVKDGKVRMEKLGMNLLEGSVVLNGEYNTQEIKKPFIDFHLDISRLDITSTLSSFSMLQKIFPDPQDYVGKVSALLNLHTILDEHMSPVLNTVQSKGQLNTHNIEIRNSKLMGTLADVLKNEKLRTLSPGDLNIKFEVKDGRIMIEPMQFKIDQVNLNLSGDQGLDMTLNYNLKASVPVAAVGATDILKSIPGGSNIKELSLTGSIRGTVTKPEIKLSMADMVGDITKAVTETVTQKVEEAKEQAKAEVNAQVDKLLADAQNQAEKLRSAAKQLADKTRSEANAAADKLEKEAESKSTVEKRLVKVAADKLRKEGESNAKKIEQETEKQIQNILDAANKTADEIKNK